MTWKPWARRRSRQHGPADGGKQLRFWDTYLSKMGEQTGASLGLMAVRAVLMKMLGATGLVIEPMVSIPVMALSRALGERYREKKRQGVSKKLETQVDVLQAKVEALEKRLEKQVKKPVNRPESRPMLRSGTSGRSQLASRRLRRIHHGHRVPTSSRTHHRATRVL